MEDVLNEASHHEAALRLCTRDHPSIWSRPWGSFQSFVIGRRHQVKHIIVEPGKRLSLQLHHHRSEHWGVLRGTAFVVVNATEKLVYENESIFIPVGATHRLENPGKIALEIIEVQIGEYLGEDDIIRVEDDFDRV
jgi:mannose-1-phosphate guanylyltransferase / mannose-6-phosphate isomerase